MWWISDSKVTALLNNHNPAVNMESKIRVFFFHSLKCKLYVFNFVYGEEKLKKCFMRPNQYLVCGHFYFVTDATVLGKKKL